jgi:hypothetical protein
MAEMRERMHRLKDDQSKLLAEYEALVSELESRDDLRENERLRKQLEETGQQLHELQKEHRSKLDENRRLRASLTEQILDEKLSILKQSQEKLSTYFGQAAQQGTNRLTALERETAREIQRLEMGAGKAILEERSELLGRIRALSAEVQDSVRRQQARMEEEQRRLSAGMNEAYRQLADQEVSEETIQRRLKQNQVEMKIGLGWLNKIGILLILLGVGAAFKYSYSTWFNSYMKGSAFFLLGALMLVGGEWLYRRQKQTFALGLLGGGISVLYGSIFYSYFLLDIIGLAVGMGLSVGVTVLAVLLSLRYRSRTVCSLGLIGGYLPLFSYMGAFGLEGTAVYAAMGYLLLLNLFILIVSFMQKWSIVSYISFLFNIPSMLALVSLSPSDYVSMGYSLLTFLMYLGITLGYSLVHKAAFRKLDIALLGLNTLVSCVLLYALFHDAHWDDYRGLLALTFCVLYAGLGRFVEKAMSKEKAAMVLFYGTSLTFAVLIVPFQFGVRWLSFGWLVEAVVLMIGGHLFRLKSIERAGWGIMAICAAAFLWWDVFVGQMLDFGDSYFTFKYSSITLGLLLTALYYTIRDPKAYVLRPYDGIPQLLKYASLVNVWFYLLYISHELYSRFVPASAFHYSFYQWMLAALLTVSLAYGLTKVKVLYDRVVQWYSYFLYVIGYLMCLYVTVSVPALWPNWQENTALEYLALGILIAFNVLIFASGRDLLKTFLVKQNKSMELYPVVLGVYLLGMMTSFLVVQFQLGHIGLVFSLLYLVLAIAYIFYGFRNRYVLIRRMGLGLTLLSTGKLILYDLAFLSAGSKIFAYFCFGVVLLSISFMYQKVSSKIEQQHAGRSEEM